jgi:hypothetical protein
MNWKIFFTALSSGFLISMPQNMTGCGPTEEPTDYFTSFFSRELGSQKDLKPFFYTSLVTFYSDYNEDTKEGKKGLDDMLIAEWKQYCENKPVTADVRALVFEAKAQTIQNLINHLNRKRLIPLSDSVLKNTMATWLLEQKNLSALNYLLLAKQTEAFSVSDDWSPRLRKDSLSINEYIERTRQLYSSTADAFIKARMGFQLCKMAFYNRRFNDCVQWYESYLSSKSNAVQQYGLSYKAGSLFRMGRNKEAAIEFSRLFFLPGMDKQQIFLGFLWSTNNCDPQLENEFAAYCKTSQERARMLTLFALHGSNYRLATLRKVYELDPSCSLLPLLSIREINKLEEKYLTPGLDEEKGGKQYYYSWVETDQQQDHKKQLALTISAFKDFATNPRTTHPALYYTGAAYLSFINREFSRATQYLSEAGKYKLTDKLSDQVHLINLLIMANEPARLNAEAENQILPSLRWLQNKAAKNQEYSIFLRNLLSGIIAQRYEQQNEKYKAALAYGVADNTGGWEEGTGFIQNEMSTGDLMQLYQLYNNPSKSGYEKFMLQYAAFKLNMVISMIGTSYLRDHNFAKAVEWLKKSDKSRELTESDYDYKTGKSFTINVDPFFDYVNDRERFDRKSEKPYTQLSLARKLLEIEMSIRSAKNNETRARLYYQMANGLYNISFYGNSWEAVDFYRHTSTWNTGVYKAPWQKEYYGVHRARSYFQKAYELTANREFKAACYFLVIKCAQRQVVMPDYEQYTSYEQYRAEEDKSQKKFKNNPLFANFKKEFGATKYYQYVFDRCSYLRDFVESSE